MQAPPELRAVHPLGKSPVITDGGKTIAETGAIVEYLIETYGKGALIPPAGSDDRLRYTYWIHYAEGSAMPPLLMKLMFGVLPTRSPGLLRPLVKTIVKRAQEGFIDPQINAHLAFWDAELGKSQWFAGEELTGADIMMSFPIQAVAKRSGLEGRPRVAAFIERAEARPAYLRALERGGPYSLL
jgi:glutathione S-transferase